MTTVAQPAPTSTPLQGERVFEFAAAGDAGLGPFRHLPGTWTANGTGWNMIALPFAVSDQQAPFRLLLNQFKEHLTFSLVDKKVPNRGLDQGKEGDEFLVALDYEQLVKQVAVTDEPQSQFRGAEDAPIHHEPGLFLDMTNFTDGGPTIARLATIPHGDSVLATGTVMTIDGPPTINAVNGLPVGVPQDLDHDKYLEPYRKFHDHPFVGNVTANGFPGFDPTQPHKLLQLANDALTTQGRKITRTTVLDFSSANPGGGINNIPFVGKQANATSMDATFWVEELDDGKLRLQYLQVVMLEFFPRRDGLPGRIAWPHVSINTLDKTSDTGETDPDF